MSIDHGGEVAPTCVAVFGLGYVGCVTAACLADAGHNVIGVDKDGFKVDAVNAARAPFYEPGLESLLEASVAAGRLCATTQAGVALAKADIALLCVGTPSAKNGNLSTEQLERVAAEIASVVSSDAALKARNLIVAVRSTVFPGTCEHIVAPAFAQLPISVVANPEFLREGTAVRDFQRPSLIVVGGDHRAAVERVGALYAGLPGPLCLVSLRTAEMIKYACNAYHAVKIAFANEIGALSDRLNIDGVEVMQTLCEDTTLNISRTYLKPGFAFGGSCLPKDLRALSYRAIRLDLNLPLLESALPSNEAHLMRGIEQVMERPVTRIGVYGLAFKQDTDDVRESPVVALLEHLIGKGREVRVFDPHIRLEALYGSNQSFLLKAVPHISRLLCRSFDEMVEESELIVVAQHPPAELAARFSVLQKPVINLVRSASIAQWERAGACS
ncbi:MAG: nucleotide sugar dehydrogenase [Vicinamibacterales bacterium]